MNGLIKPAPPIVSHAQAKAILVQLKQKLVDPELLSTLARYIVEREATSIDLRNTVDGVLKIAGPSVLKEIKEYVERNRPNPAVTNKG